MPLAGLPVVDETLADALTAQGEPGVRALGLLRDAHRVLTVPGFLQPEEVAAACVRSAADALLGLSGSPGTVNLTSPAKNLLAAVDAVPSPAAVARAAAPGATDFPASSSPTEHAAWERVTAAADVLRAELNQPGHQERAARIVERLMGVTLGAAQETALDVWRTLYGVASGILHGRAAAPGKAASLYTELLSAARNLLVPLPARAARVLELTALTGPGEQEARELAGWADPRATGYFFRSGPAPAWLHVLDEHAPHLLLPDKATGRWPAARFFEHLAAAAPDTARPWLAAHAEQLAAAGPDALYALLLAPAGALTPAGVRLLLPTVIGPARAGMPIEPAGWPRGLTARWACTLPMPQRDGDWLAVIEELLKDVVDAGFPALQAMLERPHATEEWAALLPEHDVVALLRELVATVHSPDGVTVRWDRRARNALAGLLCRNVSATSKSTWQEGFVDDVDLDEVRLRDDEVPFLASVLGPFLGPLLARAVLDLAAADAAAGIPLVERMRGWPRIDATAPRLHDRMLAAHLAAHPPAAGTDSAGAGEWWDRAVEVTVRLLVGRPNPEGARLAALVLDTCPPERAADLNQRARAALGPAPSPDEIDKALPAAPDATQASGRAEPPASWLRLWHWSPVLPAPLLTDFAPLLAALHRLKPAGPPDPRSAARPPSRHDTVVALQDLLDLAAAAGPLEAAAALAAAEDAGADGYALVLQRLVGADPAAWTADIPQVLAVLARPELGAFYLAAVATVARAPGAFPTGPAEPVLAALALSRALPAPASPYVPDAAEFAGRAWSDLLSVVWHTGADLDGYLPTVLDNLRGLAEPLTRPAPPPPASTSDTPAPSTGDGASVGAGGEEELPEGLLDSHPAVRALDCLLDYAASRAPADGEMPADILRLLSDVLAARLGDQAVAAVIGAHLPVLHRRATAFTAAHPELYALDPHRPSPASVWLARGRTDPLLLAALHRDQLLAAVRENRYRAATRVAFALLLDGQHDLLGDPVNAWREVAGPDGAGASHLLMPLALSARGRPRSGDAAGAPAARAPEDVARTWWTAALEADLPSGALADAGYFVSSALTDEVWLPLARRSAEHTPAQTCADKVAERAADHPRSPEALLLAAHLLTRPAPDPEYGADVRRHARALLQAAEALPEAERPTQTEQLRRSLVEAGEVDLAPAGHAR